MKVKQPVVATELRFDGSSERAVGANGELNASSKKDLIAQQLKLICVAATGYNNIDLTAATEYRIPVCNARGYATPSVVQHVFMLMLNLARHFNEYQELVKRGGWQTSRFFCPLDYSIQEVSGKVLGIIGYGELGRAVAEVAKAFGMQLLIADHKGSSPRAGRAAFDEVLAQADFISLHCPYSVETHHLIGRRELELMKSSAYLINTARGKLIHEEDLLHCLSAGRIAGAAIDVMQQEPPDDACLLLRQQPANLIVTPHIAWASRESRQRLLNQVASNIKNFLRQKPFNQIVDALSR